MPGSMQVAACMHATSNIGVNRVKTVNIVVGRGTTFRGAKKETCNLATSPAFKHVIQLTALNQLYLVIHCHVANYPGPLGKGENF